jgi:hypothetical protein
MISLVTITVQGVPTVGFISCLNFIDEKSSCQKGNHFISTPDYKTSILLDSLFSHRHFPQSCFIGSENDFI